jgi:hypothetical protein
MMKRHIPNSIAERNSSSASLNSAENAAALDKPQAEALYEHVEENLPVTEDSNDICAAEYNGRQRISAVLKCQRMQGNRYVQCYAEGGGRTAMDPETALRLERNLGKGHALPAEILSPMVANLNHDFSEVRVHTDAEADVLARQMGAGAFTSGNDIFFRKGAYSPSTAEGRHLLGHELVHTVQQSGLPSGEGQIVPCTNRELEAEADMAAEAALSGNAYEIGGEAWGQVQFGDNWLTRAGRAVSGVFGGGEEGGVEAEPGSAEYEDQVAGEFLSGFELVIGGPLRTTAIEAVRDPEFISHLRETRSSLTAIPISINWIKRAWDIQERAGDILEVVNAFRAWSEIDAMEDPEGYAREAGRSLAALGTLGRDITPEIFGMVRGLFDILSRCGTFFSHWQPLFEANVRNQRSGAVRNLPQSDREEMDFFRSSGAGERGAR